MGTKMFWAAMICGVAAMSTGCLPEDTEESADEEMGEAEAAIEATPIVVDPDIDVSPGKKKDKIEDLCWELYNANVRLCQVMLDQGGGAVAYNACMNDARNARNQCLAD